VRTAFGAGNGVHLVDDDGLHTAERLARRGCQHQEQRFRRGDEDVGRVGDQLPAGLRRGVTGADADGDLRHCQAVAFGDAGDTGQGRTQVAFDVDGQRLERGDVEHPGARLGRREVG
jgi:hypothetical protein